MKRWALPLLVVINLALLGWLASRWITPDGKWIGVRWVAPVAQRPALDGGAALPQTGVELGHFVATLERPLFVATRRPPPPPQAASAAGAADPLTDLRLLGVYGNQQVGGVIVRVDSRVRRLKVGETLGGWTLRGVRPHVVELARGDEVRSIEIKRAAGIEPQLASADGAGGSVAPAGGASPGLPGKNARSAALEEMQRREREERRAQTMRMNALRARMGVPLCPNHEPMKSLFRVCCSVLAGAVLLLLGGCVQAPLLAQPSVVDLWPVAKPQHYRAGVAVVAPDRAASSAAVESPRLIRGTDKVLGSANTPPMKQDGAPIDLRFEDTPVREAVHAILGDLLKQDYVVYPPADGRVTIATSAQVSPDTAVFMLEAALSANGLAMVRDARGVFHIGKADALKAIAPAIRVAGREPLPPGSGAIVVPLRYIGAAEMATILRPMVSADAIVRVDTVRNLLVLVGNRAQAEGWLGLVATFDIDLLAGMSVGVFPLKYASVADVEAALQMMSSGAGRAPAAAGAAGAARAATAALAAALSEGHPLFGAIRVLPLERLNSVVVVTSRAAYLDEARRWIEKLDQPSNSSSEARLFVYPVRNGSARHLGEVLKGIYGGSSGPTAGGASGVAPGLASTTASTGAAAGRGTATAGRSAMALGAGTGQPTAGQSVTSVQLASNVRVVADELNNAILVYGSPAQFEKVEEALRKLDTPPTQVLIEASIIEVTLNDELNYGVQWLFSEDRGGGASGTSVLSTAANGLLGGPLAGFSYTLRNSTNNVRTVLNALAGKSLVKVISSPSLMVLDNHTAQIVVGNQTPIKLGETVSAEGGLRTTNIQYKDTGVSLSVTPSVGAGDMVTMNVNQSVTDIGARDEVTGQVEFLQRQIGTKVAVRSSETIILGGLIRDNVSDGSSGIPLLSEIPVLGALFGAKSRNAVRTELLVIITPRVARSDEDTREINRTIRERLRGLGTQPLVRDSVSPPAAPSAGPVPDPSRPQ